MHINPESMDAVTRALKNWAIFEFLSTVSMLVMTSIYLLDMYGRQIDVDGVLLNSIGLGMLCLLIRAVLLWKVIYRYHYRVINS